MNKRKGLTLIELLVVITILAIFFGAFSFYLSQSNIREANIKATAENTAQILRNIRNIAIARNSNLIIRRAPQPNTIEIIVENTGDMLRFSLPENFDRLNGPKNGVPSQGIPEAQGSLITPETIIFSSTGACLTPCGIYFSDGKNAYAIGISRSGRIKIWKWGGSEWY